MAENQPLQEQQAGSGNPSPAQSGAVPPTSSAIPLHKRNADENSEQDSKRPKVVVDESNAAAASGSTTVSATSEGTKTVTPTSATTTEQQDTNLATTKAASKETEKKSTEVLDLAETLGLKSGTEIEVQWEIHNDSKPDPSKNTAAPAASTTGTDASTAQTPSVSLHWWKAKLLEHDGRTTDSVAIRTLLYEPRPDLGFPKESREDVVFLGRDVLVTSTNSNADQWDTDPENVNQMPYRRIDAGSINDEVFFYNEDQLEEQLNTLLMGAFSKNQAAWNAMPTAQQAIIAEQINKKKKQLASILRAEAKQNNNQVITPEAIKDILARTFWRELVCET